MWDIGVSSKMQLKMKDNEDIFHLQIKQVDNTTDPLSKILILTILEAISLPKINVIEEHKGEGGTTSLLWTMNNGRRKITCAYLNQTNAYSEGSVNITITKYKVDAWELDTSMNMDYEEYKNLQKYIPTVCNLSHTFEKLDLSMDENAQAEPVMS